MQRWIEGLGTGTRKWMRAAGVRALKTAAQTALGAMATTALIQEVHWQIVGGAAAIAAALSILTSIAGIPEVDDGASVKQIFNKQS